MYIFMNFTRTFNCVILRTLLGSVQLCEPKPNCLPFKLDFHHISSKSNLCTRLCGCIYRKILRYISSLLYIWRSVFCIRIYVSINISLNIIPFFANEQLLQLLSDFHSTLICRSKPQSLLLSPYLSWQPKLPTTTPINAST